MSYRRSNHPGYWPSKLTKSETLLKSAPRLCKVAISHLCEAVEVGLSAILSFVQYMMKGVLMTASMATCTSDTRVGHHGMREYMPVDNLSRGGCTDIRADRPPLCDRVAWPRCRWCRHMNGLHSPMAFTMVKIRNLCRSKNLQKSLRVCYGFTG